MGTSRMPRIARLRTPARIPKGSHLVQMARAETHVGGPGDPPPGFVIGQTSSSEWRDLYWPLAKIFKNPVDPRQPPFYGGWPDWAYQVPYLGAFTRSPGSAVVDATVYLGREVIGLRLQTQRYHILTESEKQASDALQRASLERFIRVVDVFEIDGASDPEGTQAIQQIKFALSLIERISPIYAGVGTKRTA